MRALTKEEIRTRQLAILDAFVAHCNAENLQYYLCGGTLLGAIRHKGFIPWDDDIDVFMPRPDFEKIQNTKMKFPYEIHFYKNGKTHQPFIKIVDSKTFAQEKNSRQPTALWVDVFAIDSLFENDFLNKWHYRITKFFRKGVYYGSRPRTGLFGKISLKILKLFEISPIRVNDFFSFLIDNISKIRPYQKGRFLGGINWGYGPQERMKREDLEKSVIVEFEGKYYNAPIGYEKYLQNLYGDFMKLPPEEKRKSHGLLVWENEN
jgi:lipopolysaccharide cholinephosphotransferase